MNLPDELKKLADLRASGALSDEEFQQAKARLLSPPPDAPEETTFQSGAGLPGAFRFQDESDESVGKAANRYVTFQMIMAVVGILIFLVFFAPLMCSHFGPGSPSSGPQIFQR